MATIPQTAALVQLCFLSFISVPKGVQSTVQLSSFHVRKDMLKILQARLQQYMNQELPDAYAGFQRGRGTRNQIANIR